MTKQEVDEMLKAQFGKKLQPITTVAEGRQRQRDLASVGWRGNLYVKVKAGKK